MNKAILNTEIQDYISSHINSDTSELLLRGIPFKSIDAKTIIEQIEAKKRCEKKLPTWFKTEKIYYPNKLNIEQTSSEITAKFKAELISGKSLIDITGGFGVDAFYFAKKFEQVTHCEINAELSEIVNHNYGSLNVTNIECLNENGIDALKRIDTQFDWIYVDPSRRDKLKEKVFLISDCTPNITTFQDLFLKYAKYVMIKTSPLLDIKATVKSIKHVKVLHIVAVNNEVKEMLWVLERDSNSDLKIITTNITKSEQQHYSFNLNDELNTEVHYSQPLKYLYEPNAAIMKSGAFKSITQLFPVQKLHQHSHLYTSDKLIEFPGRSFVIKKVIPYNKKVLVKEKITKANITTRNFSVTVSQLRKKFNIKDGGSHYLFFTTDNKDSKIIIICIKA